MVYNLTLRSQVVAGIPASQKHKALVKDWSAMEGCWKLSGEPAPPGTEFDCLSATCKLTRYLPPKVKGEVTYAYRPEDGSETDWLDSIRLEFNPHRVAYKKLLEMLFQLSSEPLVRATPISTTMNSTSDEMRQNFVRKDIYSHRWRISRRRSPFGLLAKSIAQHAIGSRVVMSLSACADSRSTWNLSRAESMSSAATKY